VFSGDSVKGSATFVRNNSSVNLESISLFILLDKFLLLKLLKSPSNNFGASVVMEFRSAFSSVQATIEMRKKSNSRVRTKVYFASKRSNSVVDPIVIERG